jgi:cellulose biosynthesis protein BcsQ
MQQKKRSPRRLEEVSHFFLSHQARQDVVENHIEKRFGVDDIGSASLDNGIAQKQGVREAHHKTTGQQHSCFLFCSNNLFVEKSVLSCNLALEFARRGFSVRIIETTTKLPTVFFLLQSLLPESKRSEPASSLLEKLLSVPSTIDPPEPLQPIDISHGYRGSVQAVFFEEDLHSADSFTMINRLKGQADFLVVNAPANILRVRKMIALVDPFIIVPSTAHPDELLSSYMLVRQISQSILCSELGHLIVGECSYERAEAASRIMAKMAHKFVSTRVRFMGMVPKDTHFSRSILTRTPLLLNVPYSPTSRGIQRLANCLIENTVT